MKSYLSAAVPARGTEASRAVKTAAPRRAMFMARVLGLCTGFMVAGAQASFTLVDDFDNLRLGNINGQDDWSVTSTSGEVALDPAASGNQVLQVSTESGTIHKEQGIAQDATRMLFLRLRFAEHGRYSFGFSPLSRPDEYSDFGPELGMAAESAGDPNNEFRVANSLTTGVYDVLETLLPDTWYNIWVLIDTSDKTYQVWMNSSAGGSAQGADQLTNDAAEKLFGFRTSAGSGLTSFYIKTGGGDSPVNGRFYIDDIYLEDNDDINLNNPLGRAENWSWLPSQLLFLLD